MFLGRGSELSFLTKKYQAEGSSIAVVYGQSYVGRHALINEFVKNLPSKTFVARACSGRETRYLWGNEVRGNVSLLPEYPTYAELFKEVLISDAGKMVIVTFSESTDVQTPSMVKMHPQNLHGLLQHAD